MPPLIALPVSFLKTQDTFGCSPGLESACSAGDTGSTSGSGRSPGEGNGNPLQSSCLKNPMDRESWQAAVHSVAESNMTKRLCTHARKLLECHGTLLNFSPVQFSRSVMSDSLRPHELQHARPPYPSLTPRVHSDSRPSSH